MKFNYFNLESKKLILLDKKSQQKKNMEYVWSNKKFENLIYKWIIKKFINKLFSFRNQKRLQWLIMSYLLHPIKNKHKIKILLMSNDHSYAIEFIVNTITMRRKFTGRIFRLISSNVTETSRNNTILIFDPMTFLGYEYELDYVISKKI